MDINNILECFFEEPNREYHIRQLAKMARKSPTTMTKMLEKLRKEKVIQRRQERHHTLYKAANTTIFKIKKTNHYIEKIITSGLLEEIVNKLNPSCVILFGSIRKGESEKGSDIDLFVESQTESKINTGRYEKNLKHKIQLFIEKDIHKLQPHLFNNVVNGIKLHGSFKIK